MSIPLHRGTRRSVLGQRKSDVDYLLGNGLPHEVPACVNGRTPRTVTATAKEERMMMALK